MRVRTRALAFSLVSKIVYLILSKRSGKEGAHVHITQIRTHKKQLTVRGSRKALSSSNIYF